MLIYFIVGVVAALAYSVRDFFYRAIAFFSGKKVSKDLRTVEEDILLFSEGAQYYQVFLPVIRALNALGARVAYYTMDEKDPILSVSFANLRAVFIGNGLSAFALMNNLHAKVVAMTTPQLDVMYLKRSKNVAHYAHIIHAPTDALFYKKFAFDYFDSVLCSGAHQIPSVRALEKARGLPAKALYETGLTYYDEMLLQKEAVAKDSAAKAAASAKVCLVAPTWGVNSMLTKFKTAPIEKLLKAGFHVILRPHPQTYISQKDLIEGIEAALAKYPNAEIDRAPSPLAAMARADVLLSDVSGIIFDFAFIYEKPIVLMENKIKREGFEAEDVEQPIWEETVFDKIATVIDKTHLATLDLTLQNAIATYDARAIKDLRKAALFHFGSAGEATAKTLIEIGQKC